MMNKGLIPSLILATVLAGGFVVVWGLLSAWAVEVGAHVLGPEPPTEHLTFLADGTPRVIHQIGSHGDAEWRDLEGRPVPPPENEGLMSLIACRLPTALAGPGPADEVPWSERLRSFSDGRSPATFWYFLADGRPGGTGYFVGYDSQSNARVGYLGTAGFRPDMPPAAERFPFDGVTSGPDARLFCAFADHNPTEYPERRNVFRAPPGRAPRGSLSPSDVYVLADGGTMYHADLHGRTVEVALVEPRLRSAAVVSGVPDMVHGTPQHLAARTDDAVLVLDEHGGLRQRYPIPEDLRRQEFHFAETSTGEALMYWNSPDDSLREETEHRMFWVSPDGRTRQATTTLAAAGGMRPLQTLGGVVVPAPLVLGGLVGIGRPWELGSKGLAPTYQAGLRQAVTDFWPALVIAQVFAAGLALLCYRRQVRFAASRAERILWPLFVLALGLPGWIGYRFSRSWPVLESCPSCTTRVPRDRESCARCATDFPRPVLQGTEVFA